MLKYLELGQSTLRCDKTSTHNERYIHQLMPQLYFFYYLQKLTPSLPFPWSYFVALFKENETKGKYCDGN